MLMSVMMIVMGVTKAAPTLSDHMCVPVTVDTLSLEMEGLVWITMNAQTEHTTVSSSVQTYLVHSCASATWDIKSTVINKHAQVYNCFVLRCQLYSTNLGPLGLSCNCTIM